MNDIKYYRVEMWSTAYEGIEAVLLYAVNPGVSKEKLNDIMYHDCDNIDDEWRYEVPGIDPDEYVNGEYTSAVDEINLARYEMELPDCTMFSVIG